MIFEELAQRRGTEITSLNSARSENQIANVNQRFSLVPGLIRRRESLFATKDRLIRQQTAHCFPQNDLALMRPQFEFGGDTRDVVNQLVIEERHTCFDGMGHA